MFGGLPRHHYLPRPWPHKSQSKIFTDSPSLLPLLQVLELESMGDLRASGLLNSSSSSLTASPSAFLRGADRTSFRKENQLGPSRLALEVCRNLSRNSRLWGASEWRAFLDDRRFPLSPRPSDRQVAHNETEDLRITQKEVEGLNIFDRLALAWRILFAARKKVASPAEIAKQRLKMILISDRCSINDNAKRKIVNNIVGALSDFVEIESQDRVHLSVSADPDLGTVYSVNVPVRRVRPEFQDDGSEVRDEELSEVMDEFEERRFDSPEAEDVHGLNLSRSEDVEACASSELTEMEG